MLDKYDLEKIKDQRFWSEKQSCFVEIEGTTFKIKDKTINLKDVSVLDIEVQNMLSDILYESKTKYRMKKAKNNSGMVLLGKNSYDEKIWLRPPSWDCNWYWGFGYLHNKNSHTHFSGLVGSQEYYDNEKGCFRKGDYIHNVYYSPELVETTFSEKEGWELSELFKQFYLLREMADFSHKSPAGCHITTSPVIHDAEKMKEWNEYLNKTMIPAVMDKIFVLLSPKRGL